MSKATKHPKYFYLQVIDGMPPEPVKFINQADPRVKSCNPDRHCACHGGGPFYCCKCGALFESAPECRAP